VRPRRVRRGQAAGLAGPGAVGRAAGESAVERRLPPDELLAEPPGLGLDRRLRLLGRRGQQPELLPAAQGRGGDAGAARQPPMVSNRSDISTSRAREILTSSSLEVLRCQQDCSASPPASEEQLWEWTRLGNT